jgi:hypothetical protein
LTSRAARREGWIHLPADSLEDAFNGIDRDFARSSLVLFIQEPMAVVRIQA